MPNAENQECTDNACNSTAFKNVTKFFSLGEAAQPVKTYENTLLM